MEEELEVYLRAVDDASSTFESVADSASEMGDSIENVASEGNAGLGNLQESAEEVASGLGDVQGSAEDAGYSMEQLIDYCQNMYAGKIEELANETERSKEESDEAGDSFSNLSNILSGMAGVEIFSKLADALWDVADKAGTFEDSMMRARLEAEGAGISVNGMTDAVSELSSTTGRAGGEIRESFIKATARGITDLDSFKSMMTGAGAQATLLGTDIQSMADKFSGFASRSHVMEKALANTGITVEELGQALGIQGATIDDVNAKWETLDENQRAAALGMAASMNEGQTANEEYKKSWAGLQAQIDIAKGRLERLAGEVLLPVLVPALETAARVLTWLGDTVSAVMKGPFGGLISVLGSAVAAFALIVPGIMAVQAAIGLFEASLYPAIVASWELLAPWLPFIAIGAAVAVIIYEIGKAFGWWTDVSSMVDAIWAGIQRLWSAFINHPDVQGFLSAMGQAWNMLLPYIRSAFNLVMSFFVNANSGSKFDFVRSLINALGIAWKTLTAPIRLVIKVVQLLWTTTKTAGNNIRNTINNIRAWFAALPGRIRSAISTIAGILMAPFKEGYNKITDIVDSIKTTAKSIANISLSGLSDKLTSPFKSAYSKIVNWAKKTYQDAQKWYNSITSGGNAAGSEELLLLNAGIKPNTNYTTGGSLKVDQNIRLTLDLENIPQNVDEEIIYGIIRQSFQDKTVLNALVNNTTFQDMDQRVKNRISMRNSRAKGGGV